MKLSRRTHVSIILICSCACQLMIQPIKLATSVHYILVKFYDFLRPVTVLKTHDIHVGHILTCMIFLCLRLVVVLQSCKFSTLSFET